MKIYLVCPVRDCPPATRERMDEYVAGLEAQGHTVHYPPRDVDQTNDDGAVRICNAHLEAILEADEVHIWFHEGSFGCHFDSGMATILHAIKGTKLVAANGLEARKHKSFANFLRHLMREQTTAPPSVDSGSAFLLNLSIVMDEDTARLKELIDKIGQEDPDGLKKAFESYGPSWKQRGGVGAFMMLARKWDRMHNRLAKLEGHKWDIFHGIETDTRGEGLIDDVRDLRRYLVLVEAEMRARGFDRTHRDNR